MLIAHISDLHLRAVGKLFKDRIDTRTFAKAAIDAVAAMEPRPDILLMTGDLTDAGELEAYEWFAQQVDRIDVPTYCIPGNHDLRAPMRRVLGQYGYLPKEGFLQYAIETGPVRILALDTVIEGEAAGRLCAERIQWLADRLAEDRDRATIVMMHHQPFATGTGFDRIGCEGANDLAVVIASAPNVERVLCGHMHQNIITRWAGTVASVCPATAHQMATDFAEPSRMVVALDPPSYQLHHWKDGIGLITHTRHVAPFKEVV